MGFFATISRGWKMSKLSMSVVKKDPELIVYMFICGFLTLLAMIGMSMPQYLEQAWAIDSAGQMTPAYMGFVFVGYMTISIVVTFWNSAIVANSHIRLTGGDPKFMDGVSAAMSKIHIIILWGIIAGTVGLLLKVLNQAAREQKGGAAVFAMILSAIGAAIWWMMTFFMIPHMIIEGKGLGESLKSSKQMFFKSWGENITSGLGIGIIGFFFIAVIAIITFGMVVALGPFWYIGIAIGALGIATALAWMNAAEQVAVTALYLYSKNGEMPEIYRELGMNQFHMGSTTV
ncbi:MAG: hypothetical protein ACI8T6_000943 [Candidatus Poseidoniaceae archaeon]|mgnify:CR=1 FL=1|jgi:hypothetical protein|tara:strand:+ start:341 stop:1204 length:864 start_codon:yes stop_codon:yes gene_type:complete